MERSAIGGRPPPPKRSLSAAMGAVPDFATLHPGYDARMLDGYLAAASHDDRLTSSQPRWDDQRKKASRGGATMKSLNGFFSAAIAMSAMALTASAGAQDVKHY